MAEYFTKKDRNIGDDIMSAARSAKKGIKDLASSAKERFMRPVNNPNTLLGAAVRKAPEAASAAKEYLVSSVTDSPVARAGRKLRSLADSPDPTSVPAGAFAVGGSLYSGDARPMTEEDMAFHGRTMELRDRFEKWKKGGRADSGELDSIRKDAWALRKEKDEFIARRLAERNGGTASDYYVPTEAGNLGRTKSDIAKEYNVRYAADRATAPVTGAAGIDWGRLDRRKMTFVAARHGLDLKDRYREVPGDRGWKEVSPDSNGFLPTGKPGTVVRLLKGDSPVSRVGKTQYVTSGERTVARELDGVRNNPALYARELVAMMRTGVTPRQVSDMLTGRDGTKPNDYVNPHWRRPIRSYRKTGDVFLEARPSDVRRERYARDMEALVSEFRPDDRDPIDRLKNFLGMYPSRFRNEERVRKLYRRLYDAQESGKLKGMLK